MGLQLLTITTYFPPGEEAPSFTPSLISQVECFIAARLVMEEGDVSANSRVTLGISLAPCCCPESAVFSISWGVQRKKEREEKKREPCLTPPVKRQTVHILTRTNTSLRSHRIRLTLPAQKQNSPSAKSPKKCAWDPECELAGPNNNTQVFTLRKDYATRATHDGARRKESDSGRLFVQFSVDRKKIMNSSHFEAKHMWMTQLQKLEQFFRSGLEIIESGLIFGGLERWEKNLIYKFL